MELLEERLHDLELQLELEGDRWTEGSTDWAETEEYSRRRKYFVCLSKLEGLVVQRVIELSKAHMSGTGAYFVVLVRAYSSILYRI